MTNNTPSFAGLRVAGFESRRAEDMAAMVARFGGLPSISPSMREVAEAKNPEAIDFAGHLMTGQIDVVVFMTGVGIRLLMSQLDRQVDRKRFLESLSDVITIARGPKPTAALRELGLTPTHRTADPNTWREVLSVFDRSVPPVNRTVALIEYGQTNASLLAGLEARGATVRALKVYRWELPEDLGPLEANVRAIAAGQIDVALFTSSQQATNLLTIAARMGLAEQVRGGLARAVVGSIGPDTSETLRQHQLPIDFEPERSAMGHLVAAAASRAGELLAGKRSAQSGPLKATAAAPPQNANGAVPAWQNSLFMKACRREPVERVPIWLMRQAGRYMPEYRAVREKLTFLELCKNPALCAEVMITTVRRLGVDAAIIFSDLLPILEPMGLDLEFARGEGPVIHNPVREARDVLRVRELDDVGPLDFVMQTVRQTRAGLPDDMPLIGFAGAPFTLASYVVEGGASRSFSHTKTLMYRDAGAWHALLERLARAVARYLNAQIAAGASAVQLFDSWVGALGPDDYRRFVLPHSKRLIESIEPGVPVIHFATGNPALLPLLAEAGGDVIGVDWRIDLDEAWQLVGPEKAVQGNLDPTVLLADRHEIRRAAERILKQAAGRPGHIFNLGHGVLPQTPPENAIALVEAVHELGAARQ
ncbi:MAG TPA: uroporphyrinogen decarboxylase [Pirellulales bacterium]|jgi:uroporphyrinogen decarboxylase|nr:uroporphyrinogen decarboxylase [Pirellulales bacterium]